MPELPEVETVKRGLAPYLEGQRLAKAVARRADLRFAIPKDFQQVLQGQRVIALDRRAKYLIWQMSNEHSMILHLGMSGRVSINSGEPLLKHDHLVWETEDGHDIRFNDARRFGFVDLCQTKDLNDHKSFSSLGPEPLSESFDGPDLKRKIESRRQAIKQSLLDQRLVAGLGNIYVCEALFRAGIHPATPSHLISAEKSAILVAQIKEVLAQAIEAGGSSLQDHRQVDGTLGYFQHAWRVYGRENQQCGVCQGLIERITQAGRSSFFCPQCQPAP